MVKVDVEGYEIIVVEKLLEAFKNRVKDARFCLRVVIEFSHDFHKNFSDFKNFIDFIKAHGATDLSYNKGHYKTTGVWQPQCSSSASMIKFQIM